MAWTRWVERPQRLGFDQGCIPPRWRASFGWLDPVADLIGQRFLPQQFEQLRMAVLGSGIKHRGIRQEKLPVTLPRNHGQIMARPGQLGGVFLIFAGG